MSTAKVRARYLVSTLKAPARVAALLTPAEGAGVSGGQDLPAARSAQDAAGMSEPELVEPAGFWSDDETPAPGAAPVSAAARDTSNILPSAGAPRRRRITGWYTADEVRALRGELESIEGSLAGDGKYKCTWLEWPDEPAAV